VQPDRLGDLVADRHRRVQRGQRVLEDHPDLVAADVRIASSSSVEITLPSSWIWPPVIVPARRQQAA
jgi:hypothetical protein